MRVSDYRGNKRILHNDEAKHDSLEKITLESYPLPFIIIGEAKRILYSSADTGIPMILLAVF